MTGPTAAPVHIRVADILVARVAAHRALAVPGVLELRADLGQALLAVAGSVVGPAALRSPPTGVSATVSGNTAAVALTVAIRLGSNCREVAVAVQRAVAAEIARYTGLTATVAVTIADVVPD